MHLCFVKAVHLSTLSMARLVPHGTSLAEHPQLESIGKSRRLHQVGTELEKSNPLL